MTSDLLSTVRRELDTRLDELRPAVAEYERLLAADKALAAGSGGTTSPTRASGRPRREPKHRATARPTRQRRAPAATSKKAGRRIRSQTPRGAHRNAILAALEHGSHTAGELAGVTAINRQSIRGNVQRLLDDGRITKAKRGGKAAYALRAARRSS